MLWKYLTHSNILNHSLFSLRRAADDRSVASKSNLSQGRSKSASRIRDQVAASRGAGKEMGANASNVKGGTGAAASSSSRRPSSSTQMTDRGGLKGRSVAIAFGEGKGNPVPPPGGRPSGQMKGSVLKQKSSPSRDDVRRQEGGGSGGGFSKLQNSSIRGGPTIVSHDDDAVGGLNGKKLGRGKGGAGAAGRSLELAGDSEYLRIGGEDVDMISGDQLDRLLIKAQKARAAR